MSQKPHALSPYVQGKLEDVKTLLVDGANPNTKDHAGWTPLVRFLYCSMLSFVFIFTDSFMSVQCCVTV